MRRLGRAQSFVLGNEAGAAILRCDHLEGVQWLGQSWPHYPQRNLEGEQDSDDVQRRHGVGSGGVQPGYQVAQDLHYGRPSVGLHAGPGTGILGTGNRERDIRIYSLMYESEMTAA